MKFSTLFKSVFKVSFDRSFPVAGQIFYLFVFSLALRITLDVMSISTIFLICSSSRHFSPVPGLLCKGQTLLYQTKHRPPHHFCGSCLLLTSCLFGILFFFFLMKSQLFFKLIFDNFRSVLLRIFIQNKVSQKEKHQYSILTHIYGI